MDVLPPAPDEARPRWDALVRELQAQRDRVGSPSYADIAERIQQQRTERGAPDYAARIARSTVYDAFRLGRSRVNLALVREIGQALGAGPDQVGEWIRSCETPAQAPVETSAQAPASESEATVPAVLLLGGCLVLNILGRTFVDFFALPIYLDMVGTAIAAIVLGPWRGAAVGLLTNLLTVVTSGSVSLPFALVNIAGALVWGYGVRRWRMGRTLPRFFLLNILVALVCSAIAVPVLALVSDSLRMGHDSITRLIGETISHYWVALPFSNVLTSTWDKLISGFVALVVISSLPRALQRDVPLVMVDARH